MKKLYNIIQINESFEIVNDDYDDFINIIMIIWYLLKYKKISEFMKKRIIRGLLL